MYTFIKSVISRVGQVVFLSYLSLNQNKKYQSCSNIILFNNYLELKYYISIIVIVFRYYFT